MAHFGPCRSVSPRPSCGPRPWVDPRELRVATLLCLSLGSGMMASAGEPVVRFDAAQIVPCHEVTTDTFPLDHPGERLWEAKLEVSSLIEAGSERDLLHYFYRFDALDPSLRFVDYLPKTTMGTEYAGPVVHESKDERTQTLGTAVTSDVAAIIKSVPTASVTHKASDSVRYDLLPPMEQVSAAGTLARERSVYFRLRPSTQHTLEGAKQFCVIFRADAGWRGGLIVLRCEAQGRRRGVIRTFDEEVPSGRALFLLACYPQGDEEARQHATEYSRSEIALRRLVAAHRPEIDRLSKASRGLLGVSTPARIPERWLEQVMLQAGGESWPSYASHLPQDVRQQAEGYLAARAQLAGR